MPKFQKSDGFQMKRGAKPDFKDLGSSPTKVIPLAAGAAGGLGSAFTGAMSGIGGAIGGMGMAPLAPLAALSGGLALKRKMDGTTASEKKFSDTLEDEGLTRNFWGKLGFGGKRSKERKARIKELEAQEQEGIDRERIEGNTGAPVAGPGAS